MRLPVESPRTIDAALAALRDATPETRILAGGTDLMVELQTGRTRPDRVIDVWRLGELRFIAADEDGGLRLGALTTCSDIAGAALARARAGILVDAALTVGAAQIRNRATLGGNLGTASPAADLNPVLVALDARVRLRSVCGSRDVAADEFLCGYRQTRRAADELIESVLVPRRPRHERAAFRKVGTRRAQAIAKVVIALAGTVEDGTVRALRVAAGSVAPRTVLLPTLAQDLVGSAPDAAAIDVASRRAAGAVTPIDDVRSSAAYRREVLYRTLRTELGRMVGGE